MPNVNVPKPWLYIPAVLVVGLFLHLLPGVSMAQSSPSLQGCPVLPADSIWNTPVAGLPPDANSAGFVGTIGAAIGLHPDFGSGTWAGAPIGIPYTVVDASQPGVSVAFDYADESDPGPYPIPPDALIEGGSSSAGDRHVLILDRGNCVLYELFAAYPQQDGSWRRARAPFSTSIRTTSGRKAGRRPTPRGCPFSPGWFATTRSRPARSGTRCASRPPRPAAITCGLHATRPRI